MKSRKSPSLRVVKNNPTKKITRGTTATAPTTSKTTSQPPPESESPPPPSEPTMMDGSRDTLSNPLADEPFVDPSVAAADAELRAEYTKIVESETPAGPTGTALAIAKAVDTACATLLDAGLSESERRELEGALLPVLVKRNVPNIPLAEEINLVLTVGGIVVPRVRAKIEAAREQEAQEAESNDRAGSRQEGLSQERPATDNSFPSFGRRAAEADRLL